VTVWASVKPVMTARPPASALIWRVTSAARKTKLLALMVMPSPVVAVSVRLASRSTPTSVVGGGKNVIAVSEKVVAVIRESLCGG